MIEKLVGWFAILSGFAMIWMMVTTPIISSGASLAGIALGALTAAGGIVSLFRKRAGMIALVPLLLLQSVEYATPQSSFSMVGPASILVGWGYLDPEVHIRINLLALGAALCALVAATKSRLPAA